MEPTRFLDESGFQHRVETRCNARMQRRAIAWYQSEFEHVPGQTFVRAGCVLRRQWATAQGNDFERALDTLRVRLIDPLRGLGIKKRKSRMQR